MTSWAQFSQRATWPPSAAVRQFSIADITFNWPRLTWPALASRQAGPWSRKISATSRTARSTRSGRQAGSAAFLDGSLAVFVETNRFKPAEPRYAASRNVRLAVATADTGKLIGAAH